mgnify:CR=1 FL=1
MGAFSRYRLLSLKNKPRFTEGEIRLNGLSFYYADPLALFNGYRDIFIRQIYHFSPERPQPVILDLGGYIGMAAMYFKTCFPEARIVTFEPDPYIFGILKRNIEVNGFSDIKLINAGAGKREESALYYPDNAGGGSFYIKTENSEIDVKFIKLSGCISDKIDLLKLNIEGMEYEVLLEIEHKMGFINEIILEYHNFKDLPQSLGHILNCLDKNGFRYVVSEVPSVKTIFPSRLESRSKNFNLVYAKKKKQIR